MTRDAFLERGKSAGKERESIALAKALDELGLAPWGTDEVIAEREACAQIADRNDQNYWGIAREIRARK